MTGQQLKNSILQEAIQGRLVPNVLVPGEKTGAELLQDILAERQKKENAEKGKKAKKLALSTIEEEPWELPDGWCWCKLGDICSFTAGQSPDGADINEQEGVEFHQGKIYFGDLYLRQANIFTKRVSKIAHKDSVLLCMRAPVGVVNITLREICIGRGLSAIEPWSPLSPLFLCYWLRSYKDYFEDRATGSTFKAITGEIVKDAPIPLPPLSIQKAIVAKIEELFPLVDEYDKATGELDALNKTLPEKLRKSVLQEAIHGTLVSNDIPDGEATASELLQQILKERQDRENREKGKKAKKLTLSTIEDEPWELPEGWCWCKIDDIAFVTKLAGFEYSKYIAPNLVPSGIPLFKGKNVQNGVIDYSFESYIPPEVSNNLWRSKLSKKCILTPYVGTIGNVAIFDARIEAHLGSNVGKIELDNDTILNEFIVYYLRCEDGLNQLKKHKKATAQESISIEAIRDVYVPLPPLSIQHRIVEKIEEIFSAINNL